SAKHKAPDELERLLARKYATGSIHQGPQKNEFLRCELDGRPRHVDLMAHGVDRDGAGAQHARIGGWPRPPEYGADARDQLLGGERLDDVVVGTHLEAHHTVYLVSLGREHDDRD